MDWILEQVLLRPRRSAIIGAVVLLIGGTAVWWFAIWRSPQYVFNDMLARNLSTTSVTKQVVAQGKSQSVEQTLRLMMGAQDASHWLVTARQQGSEVSTESIGTMDTGYLRYTHISTGQMPTGGKTYDFNHVVNVWAKSDGQSDSSLDKLFSNSLLDITNAPTPPIAMLPSDQRDELLGFMQDEQVFTPDYGKVKHENIDGLNAYTFTVSVRMPAYVRAMQAFAHDLGLKSLDSVDPNQYAALKPLSVSMSVDPVSHQLLRISYAATGFTQHYSDWGLIVPATLPTNTITTTELQRRLQSLGAPQS